MLNRPIRCAIIDDDAADTLLLKTFIRKAVSGPCSFDCYHDYESGVQALDQGGINIAFIDLNINGRNGLDLVRNVAAAKPGFPVVVVSALSDERLQDEAISAGAYDFLPKEDIDEKTVRRMLRHVFASSQKERELRHLVEQAQSGSATKSAFLAGMSHDLRTPLNAIIGFADALNISAMGPTTVERTQEYSGIIGDSARHLLDIINTILDLAKIEQEQFTLNCEWIDPRTFLERQIKLLEPISAQHGTKTRLRMDHDGALLMADPRALRQIFINVFSNAVKFSDENSEVVVSTSIDRGTFRLTIADTGIGMTSGELKRAMQPFGQVTENPELARKGTGLGLVIVKGLVEAHKAELKIDSRKHSGTRVTISFPARNVSRDKGRVRVEARTTAA